MKKGIKIRLFKITLISALGVTLGFATLSTSAKTSDLCDTLKNTEFKSFNEFTSEKKPMTLKIDESLSFIWTRFIKEKKYRVEGVFICKEDLGGQATLKARIDGVVFNGYYDHSFRVLGWDNEVYCPLDTCPI